MGHGDFRTRISGSGTAARRALSRMLHPSAGGGAGWGGLERDLASAVERDEIDLAFQPIVDLVSSRIVGAEALMRWNHSVYGPISPLQFIESAERTGQIVGIGRHVMTRALRQLADWNAGRPADEQLAMHVNVSTRQLDDPEIVGDVSDALVQTGVEPSLLVLEITESAALGSTTAFDALGQLKALGVTLSIDDFGTGYSSLSYLAWLPVDEVKIDKSFLADLAREQNRTVLTSMILLAGRLGMTTVVEGIEHPEQVAELLSIGARFGQGYHFDRPLPPAEFARRLAAPKRRELAWLMN